MTIDAIKKLHTGDQVYWNDPDQGLLSRIFTIGTIECVGDIIKITDKDGSCIECFAWELD